MRTRVIGLLMVGSLVGVLALTGAFYVRAFADTVDVSVETSRSGLIMDPGNKVKYRGVEVGRVDAVEPSDAGARLAVAIDADRADEVPAAVTAQIRASTLFGAKYLELVDLPDAGSEEIRAGAVVDAVSTTREVNTLFESLDDVLTTVDVVAVNHTLSTLAGALDGRGDDIAELAVTADAYLTALEPSLPQLRRSLRGLAQLSDLGVRLEPALVDVLDDVVTTTGTLVDEEAALDRLLVDVALLGETGTAVLGVNTDPLVRVLSDLRPTTATLTEYAGMLPCFLRGLERTGGLARNGAGGTSPGLNVIATLRTQIRPYDAGVDRPRLLAGTGPSCGPLPWLGPADVPAADVGEED